jgi:hypothetical protein
MLKVYFGAPRNRLGISRSAPLLVPGHFAGDGRLPTGVRRQLLFPIVLRQLFFPIGDNYLFPLDFRPSTLVLTGAEDKALQGCNLSADSGARPGRKPPRRF